MLKCERATRPPVGMALVSVKDGGAVFGPARHQPRSTPPPRGRRKPAASTPSGSSAPSKSSGSSRRAASRQAGYVQRLTPALKQELAGALGVTADSLTQIGVGWNGTAWTFPERDAAGLITGHSTRPRRGKKKCIRGSKRGLIVPASDTPGVFCLAPEGPSDVAACLSMGIPVVGRPNATSKVELLCDYVADREVLVVGENDLKFNGEWPGKQGAIAAATALAQRQGRAVRWALPPEGSKDIRAWLNAYVASGKARLDDPESLIAAGGALLDLLKSGATEVQPKDDLVLVNLGSVKSEPVEWVWRDRVPAGMVVVLAGDPDLGKSTIAIHMAAAITSGRDWADGAPAPQVGRVIWLSAEDDTSRVLVPKLTAAGAWMNMIDVLEAVRDSDEVLRPFSFDRDLVKLERHLDRRRDVKLIVVDPITAYLGKANQNSVQDLRPILSQLKSLCERRGVTVLAISHFNKTVGGNPMYRVTGSMALTAGARTVWIVCQHPEDTQRTLFLCAKMNVAPKPKGLEYRIEGNPPVIQWMPDGVDLSADAALNAADSKEILDSNPAVRWLKERLKDGPVPSNIVYRDGGKRGFKRPRLRSAAKLLGIKPEKAGFDSGWAWSLKSAAAEGIEDPEDHEGAEGDEGEAGPGGHR